MKVLETKVRSFKQTFCKPIRLSLKTYIYDLIHACNSCMNFHGFDDKHKFNGF